MTQLYEIRVQGCLSPDWSAWLAELEVSPLNGGDTLLRGPLADQAALFGLLARIRDMGLVLVLVRQVAAEEGRAAHGAPQAG